MKNTNLILTLIIIFFSLSSCSKDDTSNCIKNALDKNDMELYRGQEINCESFLELYHYNGESYFQLGSHCADIGLNPVNCDGKGFIKDGFNTACINFFANAEYFGIVGIQN